MECFESRLHRRLVKMPLRGTFREVTEYVTVMEPQISHSMPALTRTDVLSETETAVRYAIRSPK